MLRKGHIITILVIAVSFTTIPVFAQDVGFYSNKLYDFSFNAPMNWRYYEDYLWFRTNYQVILFPSTFDLPRDGMNSPHTFVKFENIAESKIPVLNAKEIEKYELEFLRTNLPEAKIINYNVKSTSWGWESNLEIVVSLNIPLVAKGQFHEIDKTFYFKNRESYLTGYLSPVEYYDEYYPVYENMMDTLVIKEVAVPEFQEIVLMVLGSSIVLGIVFARKFTKFTAI